jgi:peptidoglycan hydrolase-like protein with peptidoglycan-binding domain
MALNRESSAGLSEDGILGPDTQAAVRMFQTEKGLSATGDLDIATFRALNVELDSAVDRAPASIPYDPTNPETLPK